MRFFEVVCRCGHVGNGKYVLKSFAVYAKNAKEAARKARDIPRVKHHNKHAIESVKEVDEYRFREITYINDMDPYFHCRNKQEQKATCDLQIMIDSTLINLEVNKADCKNTKAVYAGKTRIKNPYKFYKLNRYSFGTVA